ncbi:MAG: CotH kinase family protein, partial [Oscillospiraceae bacterium]|nr:CotH kinase family protein [Oscillospiraceae bacterium]
MRSARRILPLLLALVLTGCTVQNAPSQPEEPDSGSTAETIAETEPYLTGDVLPVLSIETKSQAENVMDFVTEPVAEHVAESIASWTPGYKMPPAPYYEACTVTLTDAGGKVLLSGADADVKVRGNWTTTYNKKPLRLKFAEGQEMLGLNDDASLKNWVLLAEYKDGSMLRNKAALEISQSILGKDGLYSADAALVEVEINGQYWGVYLLTEQQQVNADRVAVTKPENGYEGTDIGYFLEYDGYFTQEDALHAFAVDYAGNAPLVPFDGEDGGGRALAPLPAVRDKQVGMSIKSDIYSQEQHEFIEHFVCGAYEILY